MYIQYMKSNSGIPKSDSHPLSQDMEFLRQTMNREKEALVSMFLANAPLTQLNQQYQLIDDLNTKIIRSARD
jgi:hypothetical protein